MQDKLNLPLYFENMKELEIAIIKDIEGVDKTSYSSRHRSMAYNSDYYIPLSIWDLQIFIQKNEL